MKVIISRTYQDAGTLGTLLVMDGINRVYECKTLELPWRDNKHNISCIPEGVYDAEKYTRPDNHKVFRVLNVPNRTGILIHTGNFASGMKIDTKGCILPGTFFMDIDENGSMDIAESGHAMDELMNILPDKFKLHIL